MALRTELNKKRQVNKRDRNALPFSLSQDPHAIRARTGEILEVAIGHEVYDLRKKLGITGADLCAKIGLSRGMLSKIENGITSPSLGTLTALSRALGVPVTAFFRRFEEERDAVFVGAGQGLDVERCGSRAGHQYRLLGHIGSDTAGVIVEPYFVSLTDESDIFPIFQHDGVEFLYILEGEVVYRHGNHVYRLRPGDSLMFDADAQHGPIELTRLPVRFISLISYSAELARDAPANRPAKKRPASVEI